jgi:hypothetical protein
MDISINQHADQHFTVVVVYNGQKAEFKVSPLELVGTLLQRAVAHFHITQDAHRQALYTAAGVELSDTVTLVSSQVKPGDQLLLRPSQVKGGRF